MGEGGELVMCGRSSSLATLILLTLTLTLSPIQALTLATTSWEPWERPALSHRLALHEMKPGQWARRTQT